jgi:DNA-binding IclR family transcriptional regulator
VTHAIPTGPRATALRRELGPLAWCALECLLERSDDGRTTVASVRAIASDLGVAKNTAHRALACLARARLVEPVQARGGDGRYRPGIYELRLGDLLVTTPTSPAPRARQRVVKSADPAQLTLLPSA